jgi:uncharacterized Zn finger protein
MPESTIKAAGSSAPTVLSNCPQCDAPLAILRVIAGRSESEYWTLRCTRCGGIHLDIVKVSPPASARPPD